MSAIGVFDSGYGGLSVLSALQSRMPNYDFLYLGDNARAPYGNRSFEVIYRYTLEAVKYLFDQGCPLVILACNTASARALRNIQQKDLKSLGSEKRVLGIIRPTVEAFAPFEGREVGLLATMGTVKSNSYGLEVDHHFPNVILRQKACPMWVPLIENGEYMCDGGRYFIRRDLDELFSDHPQIEHLFLGCTHYPVIKKSIETMVPKGVRVWDQASIVANSLEDYLKRHPEIALRLHSSPNRALGQVREYLTTESPSLFDARVQQLMGLSIKSTQVLEL